MAKTRGAKTPSLSALTRAPRVVPVQDSMTEPSQALVVPPSVEGAEGPQKEATESGCHSTTIPEIALMAAYDAQPGAPAGPEHLEIPQPEHLEEPQHVEIPTDIRVPASVVPSTGPMPKVASFAPHATPGAPPVVPAASEPHPFESSIAISSSELRGLCHTLQTLTGTQRVLVQQMAAIRAHQDQLIATQTQHTAILR
ncbi:hypothetical protein AAG906_025658 [Vitis piasezkii]